MKQPAFPRFLQRFAFAAMCACALALTAAAQSYVVGPGTQGAFLNGQPLLPGTAILPGDVVSTGNGGVVIMAPASGGNGSGAIELSSNSSASLGTAANGGLTIQTGTALVAGNLSVSTQQGQVFQSGTGGSTFVINANAQNSTMGVLTGSVNTYNTSTSTAAHNTAPPETVAAGNAVEVSSLGGTTGSYQLTQIKLSQVQQPSQNGSVTNQTPASQSQ